MNKYESKIISEGREITFRIEDGIRRLKESEEDEEKFTLKVNYKTTQKLLRYINLLEYYRTGFGGYKDEGRKH